MTWDELARRIEDMTPEQQAQPVMVRDEPWQDAANYQLALKLAAESLQDSIEPENGERTIRQGQLYLSPVAASEGP
jgi:nicotinamide mononucleotide adenylyltransferase